MPKPTKGPRTGGGPTHERLLLNQLASQLFEHKSIQTTETKAKRLQPVADRLVTLAKRGDLAARRRVMRQVLDKSVVHELFTEIAPLVEDRAGGYTRVIKTGYRKGDNAPLAVIELVLEPVEPKQRVNSAAAGDDAADDTVAAEVDADDAAAAGDDPDTTAEVGSDDLSAAESDAPEAADQGDSDQGGSDQSEADGQNAESQDTEQSDTEQDAKQKDAE